MLRNTGRMNLCVARISHVGAFSGGLPGGSNATAHGVGRKVENVDVSTSGQNDSITPVRLNLTVNHVAAGNTPGNTVDDNQVKHLTALEELNRTSLNLARERRISAEQQLLTGLTTGIKGTGDLGATEGAVVKVASVVASERDALGNALINDVV